MSTDVPAPRVRSARRRAIASLVAAGTVATTVAAVGASGPIEAGVAAPPETIQILSFNDYHGHVENDASSDFGAPKSGGGEYLSTKLTELRADAATDGIDELSSFTVAAGDLIGGSPFFSGIFHDEPSVESLEAMGLDYSGVGNHEFDEGIDELIRMQEGPCHPVDGCYFPGDPYDGADFQWLAANVTEDVPDGTDDFADIILPYDITITEGGHKVAFIGMTLEGTDELVAASGIAGFTFEDEIEAGDATVQAIFDEDPTVQAMVLMLHEGGIPTPFAINGCAGISGPIVTIAEGMNAEIDAIVTGHTHQPYTCDIDDPDDNARPVVSAWSFGRVVTEMRLDLDVTGEVDRTNFTMENHLVLSETEDPDELPETPDDPATLKPDPAITAIIDKWSPLADAIGEVEVGRITEDINRGENGGNRGIESDAGNLVADAQLFAVGEAGIAADVAFMNPGGLRSDLTFAASGDEPEDGIVTFAEALTFQPFNNTMFVLPMTGEQIKAVLTEQCQPGDSSRPVLHLGVSDGFTYDLAITTQAGICTAVEVSNVQLGGVDIVDGTTYNVAVNNFLADGGDNFNTFEEVDPNDRLPGPQDIDALTDYFEAMSPVSAPGVDRVNETFTTLPAPQTSVTPARILDTRVGGMTEDGLFQEDGPLAVGDVIELQVTGRGGVSEGAESVVLNVGVIRPEDLGFLTVYPCDEDEPEASNLNFAGGTTVSNAVFAKLSADGTACIVASVETEIYADVTSFVAAGGSPSAISPARVLDNRTGGITIDGQDQAGGPLAGGEIYELTVIGREDADGDPLIPDDAKAVVLNVGAIQPVGPGYLTVFPCNATDTPPNASNVNYIEGVNVANAVTVGIGDDGAVCIFSFADTNLIADVTGFVPVDGSPDPLEPARLIDTRDEFPVETVDGERAGEGMIAADEIVTLQVAGRAGVDADAVAASLNVTAVRPVAGGFITVYPCTEDEDGEPVVPNASQVNFAGVTNVANSVAALLSDDGTVCIVSSVETHLLVDVTGALDPIVPFIPGS